MSNITLKHDNSWKYQILILDINVAHWKLDFRQLHQWKVFEIFMFLLAKRDVSVFKYIIWKYSKLILLESLTMSLQNFPISIKVIKRLITKEVDG